MQDLFPIEEAVKVFSDPNSDTYAKYNAMFHLRTHKTEEAGQAFIDNYKNLGSSALLRHETMYIMGQMRLPSSYEFLKNHMNDPEEMPVVRHEAGEALANYHHLKDQCIAEMEKHWDCEEELLRSTVRVGIMKLKEWKGENDSNYGKFYGGTIEPAEPMTEEEVINYLEVDTNGLEGGELTKFLVERVREKIFVSYEEVDEYPKYRMSYYLRNVKTEESKRVLADMMKAENRKFVSALLRHEVAFILGQIYEGEEYVRNILKDVCYDEEEHPVVRHEAILAFWDIAQDEELVQRLESHEDQLVRESVICAIRMNED